MTARRLKRVLRRWRSLADAGLGTGRQHPPAGRDGRDGPLSCVVCGGEIEPGLAALASVSCYECRPAAARATHVLGR